MTRESDKPVITRSPTNRQRYNVEYRGIVYGPFSLDEAQSFCTSFSDRVRIEKRYKPFLEKLTKRATRRQHAFERNPTKRERLRRIEYSLSGITYPFPQPKTATPGLSHDWMAPFVAGPLVMPTPREVARWQTKARTAALQFLKAQRNRKQQSKATQKGAEARRRQGYQTAAEVLALANALRETGIPSHKIAAHIATTLHITPRQVRNILSRPSLKNLR